MIEPLLTVNALAMLQHPVNEFRRVPDLVPIAVFALVAGIVFMGMRKKQAMIRAQADFHKQLLDKFGSGREFAEFLESKGGQRFLEELWSQGVGTKQRVLNTMRSGIVCTALGAGFLALAITRHQFLTPAVLLLALGLGFLVATAISYRLSKQWSDNQGSGSAGAQGS